MSYGYPYNAYGAQQQPPVYGQPAGGTFVQGQPAPAGADPRLWSYFIAVDRDRTGSISSTELERALVNGDWSPFDQDTVKLLMNIFDTDRTGTIGFNEFVGLWKYIKDWQNVFAHFDRDRSGTIDEQEMREALTRFGYNLTPQLLHMLQKKYDVTAREVRSSRHGPGGINFDRFVRACVAVKQLTESFQRLDTDRDGWVQINYEQFLQTILSLP